jgi:hypothetical protein
MIDLTEALVNVDVLRGLGKVPCVLSSLEGMREAVQRSRGLSLCEESPDLLLEILGENSSKQYRPRLLLAIPCHAKTGRRWKVREVDPLAAKLIAGEIFVVTDAGHVWKVERLDTHYSKTRKLKSPVLWMRYDGCPAQRPVPGATEK